MGNLKDLINPVFNKFGYKFLGSLSLLALGYTLSYKVIIYTLPVKKYSCLYQYILVVLFQD